MAECIKDDWNTYTICFAAALGASVLINILMVVLFRRLSKDRRNLLRRCRGLAFESKNRPQLTEHVPQPMLIPDPDPVTTYHPVARSVSFRNSRGPRRNRQTLPSPVEVNDVQPEWTQGIRSEQLQAESGYIGVEQPGVPAHHTAVVSQSQVSAQETDYAQPIDAKKRAISPDMAGSRKETYEHLEVGSSTMTTYQSLTTQSSATKDLSTAPSTRDLAQNYAQPAPASQKDSDYQPLDGPAKKPQATIL